MRWQIVVVLRIWTVLQMPCDVEWHLGAFPASCNKCASPCSYQLDSHHFGHVRSRKWRLTVSPTVGSGQPGRCGPSGGSRESTYAIDRRVGYARLVRDYFRFQPRRQCRLSRDKFGVFFSLLTLNSEFIIRWHFELIIHRRFFVFWQFLEICPTTIVHRFVPTASPKPISFSLL